MLCGKEHPVKVHCYPQRKVRSPEDCTNKSIFIFSIICDEAKERGWQYTKRILPEFVIPECNIRLDRVLLVLSRVDGQRVDYEKASQILGAIDDRTIRRHLEWIQQILACTLLECTQLLVGLLSFGVLPGQPPGESAYGQLLRLVEELNRAAQKIRGQRGGALTVIGCVHTVYVFVRAHAKPRISLSQAIRSPPFCDTT